VDEFIIGPALIAAHSIVVDIVNIQFLKCMAGFFIGNYGQAVSQVVSKGS
jgi:hypothetical protein